MGIYDINGNVVYADIADGSVTFEKLSTDLQDVIGHEVLVEIEPGRTQAGKAYQYSTNKIISVGSAAVKSVSIDGKHKYYVTTSFTGQDADFPLISYFNANDQFISYEVMNISSTATVITEKELTIPPDASWFYVNSRYSESHIYWNEREGEEKGKDKKEISILFVGNSLTQDGIAYLPYMLKTFYPEISFKLYMWYIGGAALATHYTRFTNNTAAEIFSVAENSASWTNSTSAKMANILSTYRFDIVCMQEYFNYKDTFTEASLADWTNCRNYITSHYTGENGLEFISLFHAPLRSKADSVFELTKTGNALILQKTISDDMIPNGIAVYRALSTSLDSLGDKGHLSPDGTHTQEGLPCLLQTYVTLLWLFERLGMSRSVYGLPFRMTTAVYNSINVPGANLGTGVIEGTDEQNLLAQEVAIQAYKEGRQFVTYNLYPSN